MKVEERLQALLRDPHVCVVTAVPDAAKGERLVALYTDRDLAPQEIWEQLSRSDLPRLWIPKREDLRLVESIPTLGTGKVDLRAVRQLALLAEPSP
jgi:acyl-[acyl-carrier-protein]-phospholipid O-acyltransferase / long-chain-fatty-acid--[acyl-carrier-protein] ligase